MITRADHVATKKGLIGIASSTMEETRVLEKLRSFDEAWGDIEQTLRKTKSEFKGWREATEWVRNRTWF